MGRYATRFQAGGSNTVGATYTAAAGGSNSKLFVAANGQTLSRAQYPALAAYYSGQTQFDSLTINGTVTGDSAGDFIAGVRSSSPRSNLFGGGEQAATFSGFTLYLQNTRTYSDTSSSGNVDTYRIWYTQNGIDWKLIEPFLTPFTDASFITTSSAVYICHSSGLYKTTDGLNYTSVYSAAAGVRGLAELNGVVIFCTGGTGVLTTTDFSSITGYDITGFTPQSIVNYSGVLYAFQSSVTGVQFSTNTGQTWSAATSGLAVAAGAGNWARVINNIVLVSTPGTGALYQYSTNPTGTTNTWTALSTNKPTQALYGTHFVYDSTANVLMCAWQHLIGANTTSGAIFGYRVTGVTGSSVAYTGLVFNVGYQNSTFSGQRAYPFIVNTGNIKAFYNDNIFAYQPTGADWQGEYNVNLSGAVNLSGLLSTPFFPFGDSYANGWGRVGTTNSGRRYIIKGTNANVNNNHGYISYLSVHVEESGFFKPLYGVSGTVTGATANINRTTGIYSSSNNTWNQSMTVAEASGQYIVAWQSAERSGIYYNRYNQSTRTSSGDFLFASGLGTTSTVVTAGATKNDGIYIIPTGLNTTQTGALIQASGAPLTFTYNVTGIVSGGLFPGIIQFSDVTNEVIISTHTTGSVTGVSLIISGGKVVSRSTYTLYNSTGGVVSTLSGTYVLKSQNAYYAIDVSGNIYKGSNPSALTFYSRSGPYPTGLTGTFQRFREFGETKIVGPLFFDNEYGMIITQPLRNTLHVGGIAVFPEIFSQTPTDYLLAVNGTTNSLRFAGAGTGSFIVPNIPVSSTGEAKYIIAR
jgi:hypothetical protein